jgi:hypothetical protein
VAVGTSGDSLPFAHRTFLSVSGHAESAAAMPAGAM